MARPKKAPTPYSLLTQQAMGGIHGGDGYTYQDRYVVCHIAKWILDPTFVRLMPEATGDVDVIFKLDNDQVYEHIQVKDHEVSASEFKEAIKTFVSVDSGTGKRYRKFILVAKSFNRKINSAAEALARYRSARDFYGGDQQPLQSTKNDLQKKFKDIGLNDHFSFIEGKLYVEVVSTDFHDNDACRRAFIAALLEHPNYSKKLLELVKPAYSSLVEQVIAHRGKVLEHDAIHEFIAAAILKGNSTRTTAAVLHVHNWSVEKFEPPATHTLDWSEYFDRQTRSVPDNPLWNGKLIPELQSIRKEIAASTAHRHVVFRGKTTLTTGMAIGATFPESGGWTFELLQPPQTVPWNSDADLLKSYRLHHYDFQPEVDILDTGSRDIALVFNITGKALTEVAGFFEKSAQKINRIVVIEPSQGTGSFSIQSDSEAVTLIKDAKEILKASILKTRALKTHLFFYGPLGLAIFFGQKLTAVGEIQLYEFQDPGYKPSATLKT